MGTLVGIVNMRSEKRHSFKSGTGWNCERPGGDDRMIG